MRVSTRGRYGLRAVLDLAMNDTGAPVPLSDIADRQDISRRYLEQLFNRLKRAGVVVSKPGAGGGYSLARPAMEITVGDVVRAVEGPTAPVACAAPPGPRSSACSRAEICTTRRLWKRLGDKIDNFLDSVTIKELCDEEKRYRRDAC